jgi:acetylornithine/succinyldiaminopimelate/putrescine aminotransferase
MILDEIQPGFGRTGKLFGFKIMMLYPTLLLWEKNGGGMPVGAYSSSAMMDFVG